MNDQIKSALAHVLTLAGGFVVGKGYISGAQLAELVPAIVAIIGVVWGAVIVRQAQNEKPPEKK